MSKFIRYDRILLRILNSFINILGGMIVRRMKKILTNIKLCSTLKFISISAIPVMILI